MTAPSAISGDRSRRDFAYWVPLALLTLMVFCSLLVGAYFIGQSNANSDSNAEVQQQLAKQAAEDKQTYAAQREAAVARARRETRKTWQARLDAATAAAHTDGYPSGAPAQYSNGDAGPGSGVAGTNDPCYGDTTGYC